MPLPPFFNHSLKASFSAGSIVDSPSMANAESSLGLYFNGFPSSSSPPLGSGSKNCSNKASWKSSESKSLKSPPGYNLSNNFRASPQFWISASEAVSYFLGKEKLKLFCKSAYASLYASTAFFKSSSSAEVPLKFL